MTKKYLFILISIVLLVLTANLFLPKKNTKQIIKNITPLPKSEINFSAWIPYWIDQDLVGLDLKKIRTGVLKEVLPVWYELDDTGKVIRSKRDDRNDILNIARDKDLKIIPTLTNSTPN